MPLFNKVDKPKRLNKNSAFALKDAKKRLKTMNISKQLKQNTQNSKINNYNENINRGDGIDSVTIRTRRDFDEFIRPRTPLKPKPLEPKTFKPVILVHDQSNEIEGTTSSDTDEHWSFSQDSIGSNSQHSYNYTFALEPSITNSFQTINQLIDQLHSLSESSFDASFNSEILPSDCLNTSLSQNITPEIEYTELRLLRPFNENSIDSLLAFTNPKEFIKLVHEENLLFDSEETIEDYINSQIIDSQQDFSIVVEADLDHSVAAGQPAQRTIFQKCLNKIIHNEDFSCALGYQRSSLEVSKDTFIIRYRKLFAKLFKNQEMGLKLQIEVPRVNWNMTVYKDGVLSLRQDEKREMAILRDRQHNVLYLLRKMYSLLMLKTQVTQRSIYYQLKSLLPPDKADKLNQTKVTDALTIICNMLNMPHWNLGVLSTSKGLIYGPLTLTFGDTNITCDTQNGTNIPVDLNDLRRVKSNAYFILIVEKDTVFQKLLVDDVSNKLSSSFIIITGKGYPDINTRRLLNILWRLLEIPMFIIVDADAYGVDIFLTYKFGSLNNCNLSQHLALPKLKWLGVLPSELSSYKTKTLSLQANDRRKLQLMLKRPYFANGNNAAISHEIKTLLANKKKCEIEGLYQSNLFFSNVYLPTKLFKRSFV